MVAKWVQDIVRKARSARVGHPSRVPPEGGGDSLPSRIDVDLPADVLYWSNVLRVPPARLLQAIERVGNDVTAVARDLFGGDALGPSAGRAPAQGRPRRRLRAAHP